MVINEKNKETITVSFSGSVGKKGLSSIKNYIEFLEKSKTPKRKKVPKAVINKLADEVTEAAWKKFKKAKGIQ
jgi:hypothetical protein